MSPPFGTSPALATLPGIRHGFFGRRGGVSTGDLASLNVSKSVGDEPQHVQRNRALAAAALDAPVDRLLLLRQVHSATVVTVTAPFAAGLRPEADAMVTAVPGLLLGILTADCAPVLLADREAGVIGALHAGWRGAVAGIAAATVGAMAVLGARPEHIAAAIGPTISAANYEVGPEFTADLLARHPDARDRVYRPDGGREHFDLPGFVADRLRDSGVGTVDDPGLCTWADPGRFFSHRRATRGGTATGRQIALIGLS